MLYYYSGYQAELNFAKNICFRSAARTLRGTLPGLTGGSTGEQQRYSEAICNKVHHMWWLQSADQAGCGGTEAGGPAGDQVHGQAARVGAGTVLYCTYCTVLYCRWGGGTLLSISSSTELSPGLEREPGQCTVLGTTRALGLAPGVARLVHTRA